MVLIFSAHANRSKQVQREVQQAFDAEKPVVPFRIENVNPESSLRYYMGSVHWLDALTPPLELHLEKLTASIRALAGIPMSDEPASSKAQARAEADGKQACIAENEAKWRAEGRIKIVAKIVHGAPNGWFKPGEGRAEWFKDDEHGPELVVVPAGEFMMGSPRSEPNRENNEGPAHTVKIAHPFAVGRHVVTHGQFATFVKNMNYKIEGATVWERGKKWETDPDKSWRNPGFRQDDNYPVICVNWDDARAYAAWLSQLTGQRYGLLSEAEWEYAARAGTMTPFWWGNNITEKQAHAYHYGQPNGATVPVGAFAPNPWGLYNVHGNVWEWCVDIWHDSYNGAPVDGSAWLQGGEASRRILRWRQGGEASRRVLRGGSGDEKAPLVRSAYRNCLSPAVRGNWAGFRLGRTLIS